jgi:hypothetical protein
MQGFYASAGINVNLEGDWITEALLLVGCPPAYSAYVQGIPNELLVLRQLYSLGD